MEALTIGKLAKAANTNVETVRWYEKVGLLDVPARTGGNYRTYGQSDLLRLSFIRRARDLGFTLEQVRTLLDLAQDRTRDCASVDRIATEQLAEIDRKLADLTALRAQLSALASSCAGGVVGECRIIDALAPASA